MHTVKNLKTLILYSFLVILSLESILGNSVFAQSTTLSVINPLTGNTNFRFFTNTTSVGETFIANFTLSSAINLWAWQIRLYFSPSVVNITATSDIFQPADHIFAGKSVTPFLVSIKRDKGYADFGQSLQGPESTYNGSGILAQIRFTIIQYPPASGVVTDNLEIDNADTYLLDFDLNDISVDKSDGDYEYIWTPPPPLPWLEITPALIEYGPDPVIGKQFNISVWLKGLEAGWKLVNITFGLTYDSTLIRVLDSTEGSFMKEYGSTTFFESIGVDRVNVTSALTSVPAIYPNGEGTVATFNFNVTYQATKPEVKETPMIFTGIELTDKNGRQIPLNSSEIVDGLYRINSLTPSTLNLLVAPTTVTVGANVTVTGIVTPIRAEVNVAIYYRLAGENWTTLKIVETGSDGSYTYIWQTTEEGLFQLKTAWLGDIDTLPAESGVKNVQVESSLEPPPPADILPYVLIAVVLIAILIAVSIYYWKFRKPRR